MTEPVAFCKILHSGVRKLIYLTDIYYVHNNETLIDFDSVSYKKSNPYGIIEGDKVNIICVLAYGANEAELNAKMTGEDGQQKRIGSSKRLSTGPVVFDLAKFQTDAKAARHTRISDKETLKVSDDIESAKILRTNAQKGTKKAGDKKKKKEMDIVAASKAAQLDDKAILEKATRQDTRKSLGAPMQQKETSQSDEAQESGLGKGSPKVNMQPSPKKNSPFKKRPHPEESAGLHGGKKKFFEEIEDIEDVQVSKVIKSEAHSETIEKPKFHEAEGGKSNQEEDNGTFTSCGNKICQSQLIMATMTVGALTEKNNILEEGIKGIKRDLKEIKGLLLNGTVQAQSNAPKSSVCRLQNLTDVNKNTEKVYTVPVNMIHVGDGRFIDQVEVAKLESSTDLRSRLEGLCKLYWPGKELQHWSLSGKRGTKVVNKITSDFTVGMAEILRAMKWGGKRRSI